MQLLTFWIGSKSQMLKFIEEVVKEINEKEEFNAELKVTQPEAKSDLEIRLEALENKLYKHLELENIAKNKSGPAEIRTQDLRRVKATS